MTVPLVLSLCLFGILSLGFDSFSKLCQDGERRAAAGDGAAVDLGEICAAYDASKALFQAGLAENLL